MNHLVNSGVRFLGAFTLLHYSMRALLLTLLHPQTQADALVYPTALLVVLLPAHGIIDLASHFGAMGRALAFWAMGG